MKIMFTKFKPTLLLVVAIYLSSTITNAQSITLINNPSASDLGISNSQVVFNGNLYTYYQKGTPVKYQYAKYDGTGTSISLIANPDGGTGFDNGDGKIYGNNIYDVYTNILGKKQLSKFNGTNAISLIANPVDMDELLGIGFEFAGKAYTDIFGKNRLATFDGTTITVINNLSSSDLGVNGALAIVNNNLYFSYGNAANKSSLAKLDGTTITLFNNPSTADIGIISNPVAFGSNIYFTYKNDVSKYQLAKFDGSTVSLIANPSPFDLGLSTNDDPIVYGGNLYFGYKNESGKSYLAKYNGVSMSFISNVSASDVGWKGYPIIYGSNLYFTYNNASATTQLAKFNGSSISLINNPTPNYGIGQPFLYNNNLYFVYVNNVFVGQLAKFDGSSISLITNPEIGSINYLNPVVFNNNLYFRYYNSNNKYQLAKFTDAALPLTLLSFTAVQQASGVTTNWQTANEINVSHFTLQRSSDGSLFTSIVNVSSTGGGNYAFTDQLSTINTQPPIIFYRLQMVDKDGSYTYSKTVAVNLTVVNAGVAVYPNPASNIVAVSGANIKVVQLLDMNGKLLKTVKNEIMLSASIQLPISNLNKGTYQLAVTKIDGSINVVKFVKY